MAEVRDLSIIFIRIPDGRGFPLVWSRRHQTVIDNLETTGMLQIIELKIRPRTNIEFIVIFNGYCSV